METGIATGTLVYWRWNEGSTLPLEGWKINRRFTRVFRQDPYLMMNFRPPSRLYCLEKI